MARRVGAEKAKPATGQVCDLCRERKGRNATVVHILSFSDYEALAGHLSAVFSETPYCREFFSILWTTAHSIYGQFAREKYMPLWLVYLEAHGVPIKNRAEAILSYRSTHGHGAAVRGLVEYVPF